MKDMKSTIKVIGLIATTMLITVALIDRLDDSDAKYTCVNAKTGLNMVVAGGEGEKNLWQIARAHCTGNVTAALDDLVDYYGTDIQHGQMIKLKSKP